MSNYPTNYMEIVQNKKHSHHLSFFKDGWWHVYVQPYGKQVICKTSVAAARYDGPSA